MNNPNELVPVNERDAKELTDTIVEVEAYRELYDQALREPDYSPNALKDLLDRFMQALKTHKALWRDLLFQYVGEENALYYRDYYRFDTYKQVIFLQQPEEVGYELSGN
jgi:hypothetical protein